MKQFYKIIWLMVFLAIALSSQSNLRAASLWETFNTNPNLSPGYWVVDRYAPAAFESATFDGDYRLRLAISTTAAALNRPSGQQTGFYNTQGRQIEVNIPVTSTKPGSVSGKVYIGSDWNTNHRRTDLWVSTYDNTNTLTGWPMVGFGNTTGSNPTFRIWTNNGWTNVTTSISYGTWYDLSMTFYPERTEFYINGVLVHTDNFMIDDPTNTLTSNLKQVFVQGYNFGDPNLTGGQYALESYYIYWDNIAAYSLAPSKVAYWKFNNNCETPLNHSLYDDWNTDQRYAGTLMSQPAGTYPDWSPGYEGRSLFFDRTKEQEVRFPATNNTNLPDATVDPNPFNFEWDGKFTITAFYKYAAIPGNNTNDLGSIINKMNPQTGYRGWDLGVFLAKNASNKGKIRFHLIGNWPQQSYTIDSKINTVEGIWHHVAIVYDGTVTGTSLVGKLKLYVDGLESQFDIVQNQQQYDPVTGEYLRIGARTSNDPDNRAFNGFIDEVSVYPTALVAPEILSEFQKVSFGPTFCDDIIIPTGNSDLVMWLDPQRDLFQDLAKTLPAVADGDPVAYWNDETDLYKEDASISEINRQPKFRTGTGNGIKGILNPVYTTYVPGVEFTTDYASDHYGFSDILVAPNFPEMTSEQTDVWNPNGLDDNNLPYSKNRSLFVVFQPNDKGNAWGDHPYYAAKADNRQCIFEAGGPLSGYNMYIVNGKLCFGMWNRFERKYILYTPADDVTPPYNDFYPLTSNQVYLAQLEYRHKDGAAGGHFRAIMNRGIDLTGPTNIQTISSPMIDFSGLTLDGEDMIGIGGATRTSYHDYNTGETYSDHFNGKLGDVMVYSFNDQFYTNTTFPTYWDSFFNIYDYLDTKYNQLWAYAPPTAPMNKLGDWKVIDLTNYDLTKPQVSDAYPNPFQATTSFGVSLPQTCNVTVELLDAIGNKVQNIYSGSLSKGMHDFSIDGANLSSGMYIFRVTGQDFVQSGKVILSK